MKTSSTIWKFVLAVQTRQVLAMSEGARILSVQTQRDNICIWALVNEAAPTKDRVIEVFGTGHMVDGANRCYLGSAQTNDGALVWHVFERLPEPQSAAPVATPQKAANEEEFIEKCRAAVLDALDEVALGATGNRNDGPKDRELSELFKGIDPIARRIFAKSIIGQP